MEGWVPEGVGLEGGSVSGLVFGEGREGKGEGEGEGVLPRGGRGWGVR